VVLGVLVISLVMTLIGRLWYLQVLAAPQFRLDAIEVEVDVEVLASRPDPGVGEQHGVLAVAVGDVGEGREGRWAGAGRVAADEHRPAAEEVLEVEVRLNFDVAAIGDAGA